MTTAYDSIGKSYAATRGADPRITEQLLNLLDLPKGSKILDVGAGTGNYSFALANAGYEVTAIEPSQVMRNQGKQHDQITWVEGTAEKLPFDSTSFDGAVMTLCMHHFSDWKLGMKEAARVTGNGPIIILTFDAFSNKIFWLFHYFPEFLEKDKNWFPKIDNLKRYAKNELSKKVEVHPFPLPHDLIDHFASAGWARPEIYLEQLYRSGISSFSSINPTSVDAGLLKLEQDLKSGEWDSKYGDLRKRRSLDTGYVFVKVL
ncbi:methyltransferase domain-containing protein [Puniceicoccaceae bacterium K14]|nr:methyltransferase domain-containing protein [Puniceicoccaceae bacterium K14]